MESNSTLEIDKKENSLFTYKKESLPLDLEEKRKGKPWASPTKEWEVLMAFN